MNYKQGSETETLLAQDFMAKNQSLSTLEQMVEYGRRRYKSGKDAGFRRGVDHNPKYSHSDLPYEVHLGSFVKHHTEVGIAVEETLSGWKVMLPSGLYTEVNEKDLTAISPAEFVAAVKPNTLAP